MFEEASRLKLRFETRVGSITTEDLWDLPLNSERVVSLDTITKVINKELKEIEEESFVEPITAEDSILQLKMGILKHIIAEKIKEKNEAATAQEKADKKKHLLSLIANKQDEALSAKSIEELQAELTSL